LRENQKHGDLVCKVTSVTVCADFSKASIATYLYTYRELKVATRRFHKDHKLGEGGFGEVYKVCTDYILSWILVGHDL
jgi:hypothetical protein